VVFFAGVVLSALHPSADRAAIAAQHRMVRMVEFSLTRRAGGMDHQRAAGRLQEGPAQRAPPIGRRLAICPTSERSAECRPQTPGPNLRWARALFAAPGT
jgi:hypothetical protein